MPSEMGKDVILPTWQIRLGERLGGCQFCHEARNGGRGP